MHKGAVIGVQGMGKWHASTMRETGRIRVAALCDTDEKARRLCAGESPGARFYTDAEKMLQREQLDFVTIALPHHLHAPMAKLALQHGVNTVVEKPMATTYEDAVSMIEAARKNGRFVTVFHNRRLDPWFQAAMRVVESGQLGKLFEISVDFGGMCHMKRWRGLKETMGGVMFDWGAHLVDWALHFDSSEVLGVSGFLYRCSNTPADSIEDTGTLTMRMASGSACNVSVCHRDCLGVEQRFRLVGEKGTLVDNWSRGAGELQVGLLLDGWRTAQMQLPYGEANWRGFYDNLADHLDGEAELMVTPESAARVVNVLCTAERSNEQGGAMLPLERAARS